MTLEEYIAWLEAAIDQDGARAPLRWPNAMAEYLAERIANDTLRRTHHAPGAYYKAAAGSAARLRIGQPGQVACSRPLASRGVRATACVGNNARYAKLLELGGCVLQPTSGKVMHWTDTGGSWYHARLPASGEFPAHPFLEPTVQEAIDDGSLPRVAIAAFRPYDP